MKTLRKVLLVALVAIYSFGYASAEFRFGVKAGLNFTNLDLNDPLGSIDSDENRTGWQAGVMAEFTIPVINLGMDASLMYARQNISDKVNADYQNKDFLDIPVNIKWKIGLPVVGNIITPMIFTGPDFLVALNKETLDKIESRTCEVGWNVGIGVELLKHLQISGSYCFGLNDVAKYTDAVNTADLKAKKNYWTVSAAYLF